jgi:putative transcriptional regulator
MTIIHHPSDVTLAAFASGTLDEARAVVVATHISLCAQCLDAVRAFECVGGALLEDAAPADISAGALERAMEQFDKTTQLESAAPVQAGVQDADVENVLPAPLKHYAMGQWRRIGGSVQLRPIEVPSNDGVRVFLLKAAPGTRLPRHRHVGTEWTCVFQGAFRHQIGRYGTGDFDEADETIEHQPVVEEGMPCICVVALQGGIKLQSLIGRLVQPFIRI